MSSTAVFLAMPLYGGPIPEALTGLYLATRQSHPWKFQWRSGSVLTHVFNQLWCDALNSRAEQGWTHFAMMHADIEAPAGWLDVLIQEQSRVGADVLAAVIPFKDPRGLTTTGLRDRGTGLTRRLTLHEAHQLPETFCAADIDPTKDLAINTGLWVCDFTKPWVEEVCFTCRDRIVKGSDGVFRARALGEDWGFSAWCARKGLKVFATRKVAVAHHGKIGFRNDAAWGQWDKDEDQLAAGSVLGPGADLWDVDAPLT
jgi:hypothetical protein